MKSLMLVIIGILLGVFVLYLNSRSCADKSVFLEKEIVKLEDSLSCLSQELASSKAVIATALEHGLITAEGPNFLEPRVLVRNFEAFLLWKNAQSEFDSIVPFPKSIELEMIEDQLESLQQKDEKVVTEKIQHFTRQNASFVREFAELSLGEKLYSQHNVVDEFLERNAKFKDLEKECFSYLSEERIFLLDKRFKLLEKHYALEERFMKARWNEFLEANH